MVDQMLVFEIKDILIKFEIVLWSKLKQPKMALTQNFCETQHRSTCVDIDECIIDEICNNGNVLTIKEATNAIATTGIPGSTVLLVR